MWCDVGFDYIQEVCSSIEMYIDWSSVQLTYTQPNNASNCKNRICWFFSGVIIEINTEKNTHRQTNEWIDQNKTSFLLIVSFISVYSSIVSIDSFLASNVVKSVPITQPKYNQTHTPHAKNITTGEKAHRKQKVIHTHRKWRSFNSLLIVWLAQEVKELKMCILLLVLWRSHVFSVMLCIWQGLWTEYALTHSHTKNTDAAGYTHFKLKRKKTIHLCARFLLG